MKLFESSYYDETSAKDGGFVFQAIISHDLSWKIVNGSTFFDQSKILAKLHQVDVFPDMNYTEAYATSTYYILSEVSLLKRKFDLASEKIKEMISVEYAREMSKDHANKEEINKKYFNDVTFDVQLITDHVVLREVSTSGLDSGNPNIVLKLSTGMVDELDGKSIDSWNSFKLKATGPGISINVDNSSEIPISQIKAYDPVENKEEIIFQTIIPSLVLNYRGDRVSAETFTSRSAEVASISQADPNSIFGARKDKEILSNKPSDKEDDMEESE
jgi:hypothetical protein